MDITLFHLILLSLFTLVATIIASASLLNVIRLRNVRMSWNAGKLKGYPLFSTGFLVISVMLLGVAYYHGTVLDLISFLLYSWLGGSWFLTSYFSSKRFITDHGIVKNVNEPSQTVAWHQIHDFVEIPGKKSNRYIFIYHENEFSDSPKVIRLELEVPDPRKEDFQKLISHKLGRRINCCNAVTIDAEEFHWKMD
ncbi:MAG: hypothetical protein R3211_04580 [Balneolaceae bacterium]|nr:hypothetical protein [Balneolaceae bacterium]